MDEAKENNVPEEPKKAKKENNGAWKYLVTVSLVLLLTGGSLLFSLWSAGEEDIVSGAYTIWEAIRSTSIPWLILVFGIVFVTYCIDGLIVYVFCRLYTRKYHWYQGFFNSLIGAFYSAVTPGASGGQVMQVYTLKKQGVEISSAASIMVMWFILYQSNLIVFDFIAIGVEWNKIMSLSSFVFTFGDIKITLLPLIAFGFVLNLGTLAILTLMSYSHRFHGFVLHHVINLGAKMHIVKNPEKSRESLRVQVENFKMELRRLQSNIPVTILLSIFFQLNFFLRYAIPYFSAVALDATGGSFSWMDMLDTCFLSAFHQMVTGVFPLPGGAGVSELFFNSIFRDIFSDTVSNGVIVRSAEANMNAAQIVWRFATFHLIVLVSGLVAAFYRSRGEGRVQYGYVNRQTFVTLQLETYEIRKASADTLYETRQLSKKQIKAGLKNYESDKPLSKKKKPTTKKSGTGNKRTRKK